MKTIIYYYTGTGNSLWTADLFAAGLGGAEVRAMHRERGAVRPEADAVGLVFPVHMWGVPAPVLDFIARLECAPDTYVFAAGVNAGQVSRTLVQLAKVVRAKGLTLAAGYDVVLPSNYIPWGGPGPAEKLEKLFAGAKEKIAAAAARIARREKGPVEKGPLWQRIAFTALYRLTFDKIPKMDRDFWVDDKCNSCGTCRKVCPAGNIEMADGRPSWLHRCEQCLACIQWCPKEAIQYGKKTPAYERYHNPGIKLPRVIVREG